VGSHILEVKSYFDTPEYLRRREFDIRIRAETVQEFTKGMELGDILDVGCGNGAVSLPLLGRCRKLTLMDISSKMLSLAMERVGTDVQDKVETRNEDLMKSNLGPQSCDLVLCMGVLAHVESPGAVIAKIGELLRSKGELILEITDSFHPVGRAVDFYHRVLGLLRPSSYRLNRLRCADVIRICSEHNLTADSVYRYSLPPPGSHRLFGQDTLYRVTRWFFGLPGQNRNQRMGNVSIYRLRKQ